MENRYIVEMTLEAEEALLESLHRCSQCGKDEDLLTGFSANKVCGKCTRKSHRKAVGR